MEDDASLVQRTLAGDSTAFGELYDRYAPLIRSFCFDTTRQLDTAQDLAQEVFLRAYTKLPKLRKRDQFAAWLISISRHVAQEWNRSRRRDRHRFHGESPEIAGSPENHSNDAVGNLRLAMTRLPERERMVLHLAYIKADCDGTAHAALGLSRSAFYKVLAQARARLAKLMSIQEERHVP